MHVRRLAGSETDSSLAIMYRDSSGFFHGLGIAVSRAAALCHERLMPNCRPLTGCSSVGEEAWQRSVSDGSLSSERG